MKTLFLLLESYLLKWNSIKEKH